LRNIYLNKANITTLMKRDPVISFAFNDQKSNLTNAVRSASVYVESYTSLVKEIAELSYLNKDYLLFYRGQNTNIKANTLSTLYPSIYRSPSLSKRELAYRFSVLETAANMLTQEFISYNENEIIGISEFRKIRKIQWSILQHYEVCPTPYIDITHSLRVACSFAMLNNKNEDCFIYVLGMPYLTGRISINSEHDIVNIRLLSISPPQALRPFFQEGYLAGTEYALEEYDEKGYFDFNRRLVAVYRIPNDKSFWNESPESIDSSLLFPPQDTIQLICDRVKNNITYNMMPDSSTAGDFLFLWTSLESWISKLSGEKYSHLSNLKYLSFNKDISDELIDSIEQIRKFRNVLVHNPSKIDDEQLLNNTSSLRYVLSKLDMKNID